MLSDPTRGAFEGAWAAVQKDCHEIAKEHGWWDTPGQSHPAIKIALMHSELSEALEAARIGDGVNFAEELADVVIRIMDFSEFHQFNIAEAVLKKMEVNRGRPHRHGGKLF